MTDEFEKYSHEDDAAQSASDGEMTRPLVEAEAAQDDDHLASEHEVVDEQPVEVKPSGATFDEAPEGQASEVQAAAYEPGDVKTREQPVAGAAPTSEGQDNATASKASSGGKAKGILSTKGGRTAAAIAAVIALIGILFGTHVICFHSWVDATCLRPETCRKCGRTQGEPLGHDWVEATCTEPKTCARCGETEGEALGHEVEEWEVTKKATCTAKGEKQGVCTRCGKTQHKTTKKKSHEFGDWQTTKEPTCTEEGEATRSCKNCDETETKPLAKTEHTPGDWEVETPAMIDGMGGTVAGKRVRRCTVCGTVVDEETYELSAEEAFEALAAECLTPSYEDVARDPESYRGINVAFTGEVIQVLQDGNSYTLRVNVTNTGYYWTDTIMVYYTAQAGDSRILEDDVITFYGPMHGMYSYESVLGATITVPLMEAYYIRY